MKRKVWQLGFGTLLLTFGLSPDGTGPTLAWAEPNAVTFPPLDQLEHYTTVRRGVTREHMLTSQAALDALQTGQPVPAGSHVVLVDYQSGVLERYLVAQKTGAGIDDWAYQWFWPDQTVKVDEKVGQCYACHQRSRREQSYMFTLDEALNFKVSAGHEKLQSSTSP